MHALFPTPSGKVDASPTYVSLSRNTNTVCLGHESVRPTQENMSTSHHVELCTTANSSLEGSV